MSGLTLILVLAVVLAGYVVSLYNFFATTRTRIKASIQEIGNQLKRQADLIPNLEASVKGYLKHEKGILEALASARKAVTSASLGSSTSQQAEASSAIADLLPKLNVVVESNPELKANTTVQQLMEELRDTSDKVMYARRTLIDLSADFNIKVVTFPSNLVAGVFGIKEVEGLKVGDMDRATSVTAEETKSPKISL